MTINNEPVLAVHRILGALVQLQKDSSSNAFRREVISAQVKKDSEQPTSTLGRLGRGWSRSFCKAIDRMEKAHIIEFVAEETLAITPNATLILANSPKLEAIPNSSSVEENHYWQDLIGFSRGSAPRELPLSLISKKKRSISEKTFSNKRAKTSTSPKKRATLSEVHVEGETASETPKKRGRPKKSVTQVELLNAQGPHLPGRKSLSTDLGDEEEEEINDGQSERGEFRESEEEAEYVRHGLLAMRGSRDGRDFTHTIDYSASRREGSSVSPEPTHHSSGVFRIQPSSSALNLGKHTPPTLALAPAPGPNPPFRETNTDVMDDHNFENVDCAQSFGKGDKYLDQGRTRRPYFPPTLPDEGNTYQSAGLDDRGDPTSPPVSTPQTTLGGNLRQLTEEVTISTLQTEINALRTLLNRLAGESSPINQVEIATAGHKILSNHYASLESLVAHRDGTIFALQDAKVKNGAEKTELQQSWKRAENTVARTTQRLQEAIEEVDGLKRERHYTLDRLRNLKKMHESVRGERDALSRDMRAMKEREDELEGANKRLESRVKDLLQEVDSLKRAPPALDKDSRNVESHSCDPPDDVLRRDHPGDGFDYANAVSKCRSEVEGRDDLTDIESQGIVAKTPNARLDLNIDLHPPQEQDMGGSANGFWARPSAAVAKSTTASPSEDDSQMDAIQNAQGDEGALDTTLDFEIAQKELHSDKLDNNDMAGQRMRGEQEHQIATKGVPGETGVLVNALETEEDSIQQNPKATQTAWTRDSEQPEHLEPSIGSTSQLDDFLGFVNKSPQGVGKRQAHEDHERSEMRKQLEKSQESLDNLALENKRLASELARSARKTCELEKELHYYEKSKIADRVMLSKLFESFTKYKDLQANSFLELEEKFISSQPQQVL